MDQQTHQYPHTQHPENIYLLEDIDSRHPHPPHIDNTLSIPYANNQLPGPTELYV